MPPQERNRTTAPLATASCPTGAIGAIDQAGHASRRALLVTAGVAAAASGAWWAWHHGAPREGGAPAPRVDDTAKSAHGPSPASDAASEPAMVSGDTVTDTFWQQTFDAPDGKPLHLAEFKGRPVLINFWATWCPPCVKEMPEIDRFSREAASQGWRVIGLAVDGPTPVRTFLTKVGVGFAVGLAGFGGTELAQALGNSAGGLPFTVLIDAQGRVVRRKMGATSHQELSAWLAAAKTT